MSATRLRAKSVGLARNLYTITAVVCGILNTYQVNPTAWNWRGRAGFFWVCVGMTRLTPVWQQLHCVRLGVLPPPGDPWPLLP